MSDAHEPSEAGRDLARARWGDQVVRRAVSTVVQRADELAPDLLAELRAAVGAQDGDDDG
jgi:hypothetical protein